MLSLTVPEFAAACGPIDVIVRTTDPRLQAHASRHLSLFSRPWQGTSRTVRIQLDRVRSELRSNGNYVRCGRMDVEVSGSTFVVSTASGMSAFGETSEHEDRWRITVPPAAVLDESEAVDLEYLLLLTCTIGWREAGWVSLHAGAVCHQGRCAILCAPSGGGKSTLSAALVSRGWRALGDDKLLLRHDAQGGLVAGLMQTFNLHPRTAGWFGGFGDIGARPKYSPWTEKRRVAVGEIERDEAPPFAAPTHVVSLARNPSLRGVRAARMAPEEILPAMLRQIVIPSQPHVARAIIGTASRIALQVRGFTFEVGDDAYCDASWYDEFIGALRA